MVDIDLAGQKDDEAIIGLAALGDGLSPVVRANLAKPTQPRDFRRPEDGKGLQNLLRLKLDAVPFRTRQVLARSASYSFRRPRARADAQLRECVLRSLSLSHSQFCARGRPASNLPDGGRPWPSLGAGRAGVARQAAERSNTRDSHADTRKAFFPPSGGRNSRTSLYR
jgi:hypothetical protein